MKVTLVKPFDDDTGTDQGLVVAEKLFQQAGEVLAELIEKARQEDEVAEGRVKSAVTELSRFYQAAVSERNRVAAERKKSAGVVGSYALDLEAARAEVERRLAGLRASRDGDSIS